MKENALIDFLSFVVEVVDLTIIVITYSVLTMAIKMFRLHH